MIYYIVYETTNLLNGKKYRGIHKTLKLEDGYLGSGIALQNAIIKYGNENFHRIILEFCSSYEELLEKEKIYVDEDWVKDYSNYNLKTGGQSVGILSDESKNKISETLKRKYKSGDIKPQIHNLGGTISDEHKQRISETLKRRYENQKHPSKGKIPWNKGKRGFQQAWNKGLGMGPMSQEGKDKRSLTLKKRYETQDHPSKGKDPWNKGKIGCQVPWNKGKEMEKVECPHCLKKCDKLNAKKWHFDNCKLKPIFEVK
jgi:hypothetical protein